VEVLLEPEIEPLVVRRRVVPQRESNPAPGGKTVASTPPEPTAAAEIDEQGDIEKLVEKPVQINTRSLYRSVGNGEIAGNTSGEQENSNAMYSENPGTRTAGSGHDHSVDLSGRTGIGKLPEPVNTSNKEGSVVVEITVNQRGKVMTAKAGAQGTTIQDATLWKAAEQAAMQTSFNIDMKKPVLQQGKITYIFKLK
jgi:TonB family protein